VEVGGVVRSTTGGSLSLTGELQAESRAALEMMKATLLLMRMVLLLFVGKKSMMLTS
jgi:hypothetical protein